MDDFVCVYLYIDTYIYICIDEFRPKSIYTSGTLGPGHPAYMYIPYPKRKLYMDHM